VVLVDWVFGPDLEDQVKLYYPVRDCYHNNLAEDRCMSNKIIDKYSKLGAILVKMRGLTVFEIGRMQIYLMRYELNESFTLYCCSIFCLSKIHFIFADLTDSLTYSISRI
jgi:hypothetical protein